MTAATGYSLVGPGSGMNGLASYPFTVSLTPYGSDTDTVATIVTPASTVSGTFKPATVKLGVETQQATFTFKASAAGTATISVTSNNAALTDPASLVYPVVPAIH